MIRLPIGDYVERGINQLTVNLAPFFTGIKEGLLDIINGFDFISNGIPFFIIITILAVIAWRLVGRGTAIFTMIGLLLIVSMNLWKQTMETLVLVVTATLIALLLGLPLGIQMSHSDKANGMIRPILDFMQTMPTFTYLIPAAYFFDSDEVPGAVITVILAVSPVVRLTDLGIRQVLVGVVKASKAFGATSGRSLREVQIPMAMPTVLAGLDQTILLSLSMVIISAIIEAGGLGNVVLQDITQMKMGQGFEGDLAVVILAMMIDCITQDLGRARKKG